ncbi:unnamed protein product [Adineta ricciae]|uniref:Plasma membrane ATPase n=1 Tax=Adineta ricciae TaxID=249248 RepID=A0A814BMD1_ADIRI|nr:unnamed protein product [Adineta ricciae]CAF1165237.1 unnamed protein product [Adineta ricciae]
MEGKLIGKSTIIEIPENPLRTITVEELYDDGKFDFSKMEEKDLFLLLESSRDGLTDDQVNERLEKFGPNKIEEKKRNPILKFLSFMWNPLSWVMEIAAIVAIALTNGGGEPPNWQDFIGIVLLLIVNSAISFIEERNAGNAVQALQESIAPEAKAKRDGEWKVIEASMLVPGDIISLKLGDVVPADARVIAVHGQLLMNQAALTGESLPVKKEIGDELLSGAICKQGEAEAIVMGTGKYSFMGKTIGLVGKHDDTAHLQIVMGRIGMFCICCIVIFLIAQIVVMYGVFRYEYRRGMNNLIVTLIGGIPTAMPTVLSVTLALGARQLSKQKAIVTHVSAIEELAAVTILCSDKTGTLTLNKLVIDRQTLKQYSDVGLDDIIRYAAIASRTHHQDAIDACITEAAGDIQSIRKGIEELHFKPFNPTDKRTEITYRTINDGKVHRISKGMSRVILELCTRDKTDELIEQLQKDVDEFASRGLRSLAVAIEDVTSGEVGGKGNGFKLIGLLPIYDPPREDTKETIDRAIELGIKVKMVTGDQLAIAKETGRRLGIGDNMFLSKVLKDGPPEGSAYLDIDDLVLHADGFSGVYPEHKYEIVERLQNMGHMIAMTGDGVNDAPALKKANVGIAVADASDAARSAADIVLTEPGLSIVIDAVLGARKIFQSMRNYSVYTCSMTIRLLVGYSILLFAFQYDFPSFMLLILTLLNNGTMMTISKDRVEPSPYPTKWLLSDVFIHAIVYGIYSALSTVALFLIIIKTSFFQERFDVNEIHYRPLDSPTAPGWNDPVLNSIIYLQASIMSHGLIFITRSRTFFFLDRPSFMLVISFVLAQLIATLIAVYANWGFANVAACGWTWAGIVWIWNLIWFFPFDLIKFALAAYFEPKKKLAIEETLQIEPSTPEQRSRREIMTSAQKGSTPSIERRLSTMSEKGNSSFEETIVRAAGRYFAPHTRDLTVSPYHHHHHLARMLAGNNDNLYRISADSENLRKFSLVQAHHAARILKAQEERLESETTPV